MRPATPPAPGPAAAPRRRELGPATYGPLLIGLGSLFLIDRFAWAVGMRSVLWALLFGAGAAVFLVLYSRDRRHWWALFPGFGLLALAAAVLAGNVGGGLLLGAAGAALVLLHLRSGWPRWTLLAGGALVSLGAMSVLEGAFPRLDNAWVLFLGLAATLFLLQRKGTTGSGWGVYLAVALAALGLISLFTGRLVETLIAVALIASGTAMVWRGRPQSATTLGPGTTAPAAHQPGAAVDVSNPAGGTAPGAETSSDATARPVDAEPARDVNRPLWERLRRGRR